MKKLDDFMKGNVPNRKVSKLQKFQTEVLILYEQGYRIEQILDFLKQQKIHCSKSNLYFFLSKNKKGSAANSSGEVKNSKIKEEKTASGLEIDTDKWLEETIKKNKK